MAVGTSNEQACSDAATDQLVPAKHPGDYGAIEVAVECKGLESKGGVLAEPSTGIPRVCWFILGVELCERLAFYTISGSQSFFLEHIGFSLASAGALNATMWTLCTVLAIFASWIADVILGRYSTILVAGIVYLLSTVVASVAAIPGRESAPLYFVGVMLLLPLATAGIKSNISNFGADQYDISIPAQKKAQEQFFSIFYCSINIGAALAYGFFTTFASSGGLGVPRSWGYAASYGSMSLFMLLAVVVFRRGRHEYRVHPLQERSALATLLSTLHSSARGGSGQAASVEGGLFLLLCSIILSAVKVFVPQTGEALLIAAFVCAAVGTLAVVLPCLDPSWLAALRSGPTEEEQEVQQFFALLPALFIGTLSFNALYNCMQFWYQQQACQMDLRFPLLGEGFQLSGSFFNIADCLAIITITPLALVFIDPFLNRLLGGNLSLRIKFTIGMCIGIASVLIAARLEVLRRSVPVLAVVSNCAPPGVAMSDMGGAWMMIPYFLMGLAEIYANPTLLHYAYAKSPASMRVLAVAAAFFISSVSSSLFALMVSALRPHMPNDLNHGNLEYGYFLSLALGAALLPPFLMVLRTS